MRRLAILVLACAFPAAIALPARAGDDARAVALARSLETRRVRNVKFDSAKLETVLQWLRIATGSNFVVKRQVLSKAGIDPDAVKTTLQLDDVTVATVLRLVLEPHDLVAKVEGNIVFVTTKADAMGPPVFVLHPISHLTWTKTDFHGRKIDLHPSDFVPEEEPEETIVEDDPLRDPQAIVDLVKQFVDAPWDTEGWSIAANKQFLSCRAPRVVQARVAKVLAILAAFK